MKNILYLLFLIVCLASCKKETPRFSYVESPEITKYVINHSGNTINFYSQYLNNILQQTVYFIDQDTTITVVTKNSSDQIINKEIYFIGNNGFAESSIDSVFTDNVLSYLSTSTYLYNNDFLIQTTRYYKHFGTVADSGTVVFNNTISDGNIISATNSFGCTNSYDYNNQSCSMDIRTFSNFIKGKNNKNLLSHALWNSGCPSGPSMSVAYSDYEYIFIEGRVFQVREIYTPCYHMYDTEEVTRTIRTTIYEY